MASTKQSASSQTSGLTTTDYPGWLTEALTGSTVKGSANPIGGYGFTQDQIKQMQDRGITVGDLQNLGLAGTSFGQGLPQVGQNQLQNATMLKLMLAQQQPAVGPASNPPGTGNPNPTIQLTPRQSGTLTPQPTAPLPVQPTMAPVPIQPVQQVPQQTLAGNVLNPIPVPIQPIQQYQRGGLVQNYAAQYPNYPNANIRYNPKTDPTGGYGALSNYDFSAYKGNQGAIKELLTSYGVTPTKSQLYMYTQDPQSLGSVMAGGTTGYAPGAGQAYGYSGMGGGMTTTGGIPLGTLMMMRGQGQNQAAPPPAPTGAYGNPNPTIQLTPQQSGTLSPQVTRQVPPLQVAPSIVPQQPVSPQPVSQPPANTGNVLNPIPVQLQPIQQYQSGGLVTDPNLRLSGGSNQSNQQQPAPPNYYGNQYPIYAVNAQGAPMGQPNYVNPIGLAGMLGAAALQMPYIQNVTPSGTPNSKSGVSPVGGAMIGTSVPQVTPTWESVGQNAGFSQRDIDTFKAQGMTPADVVQKFPTAAGPLAGPWTTNPGVFAKAAMPTPTAPLALNPITPATAVPYAPGQAFATPPAAPTSMSSALPPTMAQSGATTTTPPAAMLPPGFMGGAQGAGYVPQAFLQAHTSALANAGMAMYAHFGGDPKLASPEDIANFHSQLTDAVGQHIAANQPATGAKKMETGGMVPGRGNEDTVPALLTPGEYVIPKHQVAQLVARGALKFDSGGLVPDNQSNQPPEARRQALTVSQPSSSSAQSSSLQIPGGGKSLVSGLGQAAQTYGSSMGGGRIGGGVDLRNTPADPDPDLPYLKAAGMGGGGGLGSAGAQSALGGVASGLNQAAQAIASSAQPWQMQRSAIPDPSQLPQYQIPTLQPTRVA